MVEATQGVMQKRHNFVFHGKTGDFFVLCLVNLLLTMITFGIYSPWAFVKFQRYIYENMELNGVRFKYSGTGGALFASVVLLSILFFGSFFLCTSINPKLMFLPVIIFAILTPLLAVKGLHYQAMMTSLNGVRFGFNCPIGQAVWALLVLPILLILSLILMVVLMNAVMASPSDIGDVITRLEVNIPVIFLGTGAIGGVIIGKYMQLIGKNARYGRHPFDIAVSIKRCVMTFVLGMAIPVPFIMVIIKLIAPLYMSMVFAAAMPGMGGIGESALVDIIAEYQSRIVVSYLLYFAGIILSSLFVYTSLRNIFINGLSLGNKLKFGSTLTFVGIVMQSLILMLVSFVTFGLALPWAIIRFYRYLAQNTVVIGDLDALDLVDSDELLETGFFATLSRGMVSGIPFI